MSIQPGFRSVFALTALLAATLPAYCQEEPLEESAPQYKRVHQHVIDEIEAGRAAEDEASLRKFIEKYPSDAESFYALCLLLVAQGKIDEAAGQIDAAIERGLPAARFLAGPRDLLEPLAGHPRMKILREQFGHVPLHGPMLGNVTDTSASIWVRTAGEAEVTATVMTRPSSPHAFHVVTRTTEERDFTAIAKIDGLQPDTEYLYQLSIDGQPLPRQGRLRTFPAAGSKAKFNLVFGGGAGYVPANERMWSTIEELHPDLLLLLGDNVYIDKPESQAMQKYCYYRRQSRPEFRALVAKTPVYTIWDDHDFGVNDCANGPTIDEPKWKLPVWRTFVNNWVNPAYGGGAETPGCFYRFAVADVDFFMLDCRIYRMNPKQPNPSMLGPVQIAWLKAQLAQSEATFKVICSSVPWEFRTKGGSRDTWNGFQKERETIFSWIEELKLNGVLLMSADRHRSDAWKIERPGSYPLYEFNSSRLTNQHVHPEMKASLFSYNKKQSCGQVTFDTVADDPTVRYEVITIDGKTVHSLEVKRSELVLP